MTKRQLVDEISIFDDGDEIMFAHPAYDHARSTLAGEIREVLTADVAFSDYHQQDAVIDEDDDTERDKRRVILLIS